MKCGNIGLTGGCAVAVAVDVRYLQAVDFVGFDLLMLFLLVI